jgi:ATPase family associated with various cellular activities (AAA)
MDKLAKLFIQRLHQNARRKTLGHALANGLLTLKCVEWNGCLIPRYAPAFDISFLSGDQKADIALVRKRFASFLKEPSTLVEPSAPFDAFPLKASAAVAASSSGLRSRPSSGSLDAAAEALSKKPSLSSTAQVRVGGGVATISRRGGRGHDHDHDAEARRDYAVRIVGQAGSASSTAHLITALLLARAVRDASLPLPNLLSLARLSAPVVAIRSDVIGVEALLIHLFEGTQFLPGGALNFADGCSGYSDDVFDFKESGEREARRRGVHFDHHSARRIASSALTRRLVNALGHNMPVLATIESPKIFPDHIQISADLILTIRPIDRKLIKDMMFLFYGEAGSVAVQSGVPEDFTPRWLTMDDLLLSFRPGRSLPEAMRVLAGLAAHRRFEAKDEDESGHKDDDGLGDDSWSSWNDNGGNNTSTNKRDAGDGKASSSKSKPESKSKTGEKTSSSSSGWKRDQSSGAEVIDPVPIEPDEKTAANAKPPLTVEALSGYGSARDWALGLKQDLVDYRAGSLPWADMSTKLLLSGPPGTGKTTFARALCNSLQIPLVVTSVSTWLEGGHLNDVIRKMSKTFEEARALAPAILFIDEIDGIGKRQPSDREYADYWNTVVNKALELLDGAVKAEGVIVVGATNRPQQIDEALRRSGRLETHIEIPRPDLETLTGILAHHLGEDLARLAGATTGLPNDGSTVEAETEAAAVASSSLSSEASASSLPSPKGTGGTADNDDHGTGPNELGPETVIDGGIEAKPQTEGETATETGNKKRRARQ